MTRTDIAGSQQWTAVSPFLALVYRLQSIVCLYIFLADRSFIDPTLVALIVCGPLPFQVSRSKKEIHIHKSVDYASNCSTPPTTYVNLPFCQKRVSRRDAELISLQFKLTKFRLLILACLVRKIHILAKK